MMKTDKRGIHRWEWVVIFVVFIVLIALTIPAFSRFRCRAMQSEAKYNLGQIYLALKFYHSATGNYANLETLKQESRLAKLPSRYYSYSVAVDNENDTFRIYAKGLDAKLIAGDIWSLNHQHELIHEHNTCTP